MKLTEDQRDALTEVINIGVGRAAAALCELIDAHIALHVPNVQICSDEELEDAYRDEAQPLDTSVVQDFSGAVSGRALLSFPKSSGVALARILGDQEDGQDELEFDLAGILEEVGNIVLNAVLGSVANLFDNEFFYSVPQLNTGEQAHRIVTGNDEAQQSERTILLANANIDVADRAISGSLLLAFSMNEMASLLDQLIMSTEA